MIIKNLEVRWAKILGDPVPKYEPTDGNEWTVDFILTDEQVAEMENAGVTTAKYIREKNGDNIWTYRRSELKRNGDPAKRIEVIAADGMAWPQSKLIGNGSIVDVKYGINEINDRKGQRFKPSAITILVREHVPYESKGDGEEFDIDPEGTKVVENWDEE